MDKKILIIEDEPDVSAYLTAVLKNNNFQAYSADNTKRGFEMIKELNPDLICLDIMMPKETGISLYMRMKEEKNIKNIPVIIISGALPEEEFIFRDIVPDENIPPPEEFMEKPIKVDKFIEIVRHLLN